MNNLRKKMITFLFVLGLSISCSCIFTTKVKKVVASESSTSEISKDMLSVKCQISEYTTVNPETRKLRIVSTIDSLDYQSAGFDITYKGKEIPYNTTKVYESIEAVSDGVDYNYSPNVFDIDSKYFITVTLINLQQEDYYEGILIKPYVVMKNGEKVYGTHRYVSVADALDNTVLNIPVEMATSENNTFTVSDGNASYNLEAETEKQKSYYYDGTYTHFRIATDRTELKSVTSFTFSDGTNTGTATYRNLNNSYDGTANTADITWYDENSDYNVIATSADLYGFVALSVSKNFNLETIYLGADIVVNEGTSSEWLSNAADEDNTNDAHAWLPIATSTAFAGKFDGQEHTISGLYVNTGSNSQALFAQTTDDSTIQKLRMENSYFKTTVGSSSTACIAAVSSKGSGTFDTIYVGEDVAIISGGKISGGIIGRVNDNGHATISNCWFAGSLQTASERAGGIVGALGDNGKATATILHCFNSGSVTTSINKKAVYAGGICGVVAGTSELTIQDCLNVGTITSSSYTTSDIYLGAILGGKGGNATYSGFGTYATSDCCIPETTGGTNGSRNYAKSDITGFSGYLLEKLTFKAIDDSAVYWVVRANDTPALASLVDSAIRTIPSTAWHDEADNVEKDGTKVYTISTLKDLYGFAKLSAEGQSFAGEKIQLGADIKINKGLAASWARYAPDNEWLPIGKTTPFAGIFDGQGYTISGIYVKDTNYVGLFAKTSDGSMIRDVRLKNSYICDTSANEQVSYNGSVVGHGLGDLNTVYSDAIIHGERHGTGGLVGVMDGTGISEIVNCQFDGSIEVFTATQETRTGGIVGSLQADSANVTISHCLNTGAIHSVANTAATRIGGICGTVGGNCSLNVNDCLVVGSLTADGTGTKTIGALTGQKGGSARIYTVLSYASNDSYSVLTGQTITSSIDCSVVEVSNLVGELAYTNTFLEFDSPEKAELFDGHWTLVDDSDYPQLRSFVTGEMIAPSYIKQNTRWYDVAEDAATEYTIYTAEELYGLAKLVNAGNRFEEQTIYLGTDIIINSGESSEWNDGSVTPTYSWTRIGNGAGKPFAGIFDGQMHTISGIYLSESGNSANNIALFGITSVNATIKNIILENSCFKGNKAVGAIAGQGGGTFDTIHVKEDVYLTSSDRWCGGIIAVLCPIVSGESATVDAPNKITNCWFTGTLRAGRYGGGITGSIGKHGDDTKSGATNQSRATTVATLEHCLNSGTVTHIGGFGNTVTAETAARTGGICGAIVTLNSSDYSIATISDSLNIGTVSSEVANATNYGDVVGHVYGSTHITYSNVYATDESCSSNGTNSGTTTTGTITRGFSVSNIKGYDAYSLSLDYTNYWVARNGGTPVLSDFADENVLVSGDTAWYNEHTGTEDDKYIIDSVEELYGFAKLSYNGNTFKDENIYLGANIAVNSGNSSEWATASPVNEWIPIGNGVSKAFAGTFDGQGYTISGLYADGTSSNIGLFGCTTADAKIMDVIIENTYFRGKKAIGAVAGQGGGTFDTIHIGSDVHLESTGNWCGGIIALIKTDSVTEGSSTDTHTITNCWFEGNIRTERYGGGMTGSVGKWEGDGEDVETTTRYAGNLTVKDCINTGSITHTAATTGEVTARVGGLVGAVVSNYNTSSKEATLVSNLMIEDCICAGSVNSELDDAKNTAAVTGHVFNGATYTCQDVYATRESNNAVNNVNSAYVDTTNVDVIRCYAETMLGFSGYVNAPGLVYDNAYLTTSGNGTWVAVEGTYPVLKSFSAEYTPVDFAPFVLEGTTIATMVDEGAGNAVITVVDSDDTPYYQTYIEKIAGENGLGFVECYSNGESGLDNGAVYTSSYKKDNLVITVTYVTNTKTTYISAGTAVEFSEYLDENTVITAGGNDTTGETSLGMLQLEGASGSTYIIQLENGHFIVHDGGQTETDYVNFVLYLQQLAGDSVPVIDAWVISHGHPDHYGLLNYVDADGNGMCDDFYVEGVYFTEPSRATREATGVSSTFVTAIRNNAKTLRTSMDDVTKVYRLFTGQKYFFDGASMEVLLTHEQLKGYTDFNETSVWCKYTIGSGDAAKTFLNGADSSTMGMKFAMDVYSANYLYSDIFAALHHGINTSDDFTTYLKSNTIQPGYFAANAIFYSRKSDPEDYTGYLTSGSSESENWLEGLITDVARKEIKSKNDKMNGAVYAGVGENKFFFYGAGTVKLNFTDNGITGGYITTVE